MTALVVAVLVVLVFGAADAQAVPSVTFKCTPAPQNCSGWYRSNVSVEWTVAPAGSVVDGCRNKEITTDTPGTNEVCVADDGEARVAVEFRLKVDKTAPVVTGGTPARAADVNGWYNHAVGISFAGSDQTSGIASCTSTTYGGPDSGTGSLSGTCTDNAGNTSSPFPYGLKYDETAPAVGAATPERSPNAAGWFNRPVRFDLAGTDATSGIADCPSVTYGGADSATASFTGTCRDQAGNSANRNFGLKYDSTAPAVTNAQAARGTDVNGWYNHPVAVSFSGSDQLSGVDSCTAPTYSGPDAGAASVVGTCTDKAGNVSSASAFTLKYDDTAPTVTGAAPGRPADVDGWYNQPVAVAFNGTDQTSGVAACTSATYSAPDSGTASLSGTCRDTAGNVSSSFPFGLKYDQTAPVLTGANPGRPANAAGWFNRPVDFSIAATDATSGIAACPSVTYGGPDSATASFNGTCRDRAGNSASRTFGLKYDSTAPTATNAQAARGADVNGWYNRAVSIAFSGTDQLSGIDSCTTRDYAGPDSVTASLAGTCTDDAGNVSAPLAFGLKYDGTAPAVTGGQPGRAADLNGWYNRPVAIAFDGSDQTSGIDTCTNTTYGGPDSGAASVPGTCRDKAGNLSGALGFGLKYDATGPVVSTATPGRSPDANGWYNHPVAFAIDGTDATSGLADCPAVTYSSPDSAAGSITGLCRDRAGNSTTRAFGLKYDSTAPVVTGSQAARGADVNGWYNHPVSVSFSGSDQLSGLDTCTATTYGGPDGAAASVPGTCRDKAGNVSGQSAFGLKYDGTAPVVTAGRPGRAADVDGWYNNPVAVSFEGTDQTAGVDSCTAATYTGPDSATASLAGRCTDKAGNLSASFPFGLKYDANGPVVTAANPERQPNAAGWFNRPVRFDITGTDATAGVADCPSVTYSGPDTATGPVTGRCRDRAGNLSSRDFPLKYDTTVPAVTGATPGRPPNGAGWYNAAVSVAFHGTDQLAGIDTCTTRDYAGPDSATATMTGTCTDDAGNVSAPLAFGLRYDATAPVVTGGRPGREPDLNGWYNRPVSIAFDGSDQTSGVDGCTSTTYSGPDNGAASVSGTCSDKAGNLSGGLGFGLKYDDTDPAVTGAHAERAPDHGEWFTKPVRFDFTGTDALSGLLECPPVIYSGPDSRDAGVTGQCRDRAGNLSSRAFPLSFDATAPPLTDVKATPGDRTVTLSWNTTPDAEVVQILRTPGLGLGAASVLFRGLDVVFVDWNVENGTQYAYEVRAEDAAGNAGSETVSAIPAAPPPGVGGGGVGVGVIGPGPGPGPASTGGQAPGGTTPRRGLIAPLPGAIVEPGHPPLLRWTPMRRARYYNVQLFRGGRKVLSAWPSRPRYQLKQRWSFRGKRQRLTPGDYHWIVWPGFGPRSKTNYGKQIGRSTFEVRR